MQRPGRITHPITDPALFHIATPYTREAGVRSLERDIGGVIRYNAVEWAEDLNVLASQQRGNTNTSDAVQRSEYGRVVEEHQLERCSKVRWEREGEGKDGGLFMDWSLWGGWNSAGRDDRASWDRSCEVNE